jgi:hypothetical protein
MLLAFIPVCASSQSRRPLPPVSAADPSRVAAPGLYTWQNVQIVGGGFVTGIITHPGQRDLMYARTDIGGAYRWDASALRWIPLTDWVGASDWNTLGIESVAVDPTDPGRLYLAAGMYTNSWAGNASFLRSTDQGRSFQRSSAPFKMGGNMDGRFAGERLAVNPLNPAELYFGSRDNGLWNSSDYAVTWNQVSTFPITGATNGIGIVFVVFDPANAGTVYAGVSSATTGLYRSTNHGATWQAVPGQPTGLLPNHGALSADGVFYLTYGDQPGPNGMASGAVWKYNTRDGAWTNVTPPTPNGSPIWYGFGGVAVDAAHPGTVMVSTMDRWWPGDDIYRSTDGGAHWTSINSLSTRDSSLSPYLNWGAASVALGHWIGDVEIDPFNPDHVLYVTGATIMASEDVTRVDSGGVSHWFVGAKGLEETVALGLISPPAGAHLLSVVGDIGGFRHDTLSASAASGMFTNPLMSTTTDIDFAELNPAIVARVGWANQHGGYSRDGGTTWTFFATDAPGAANGPGWIAVSADGSTFLWSPSQGTLSYSRDNGATWTASTGAPSGVPVAADRVNPTKFYVYHPGGGSVYVSTDGGASFAVKARGLTGSDARAVRPLPGIEGDLWLPLRSGLYHSTDSGASFARLGTVNQAVAIGFGKPAPGATYPALYLSGWVNATLGVYRSTDAGASWIRINDDAHQYGGVNLITGDPRIFGRVYLGTGGRGILYGDPAAPAPGRGSGCASNGAVGRCR